MKRTKEQAQQTRQKILSAGEVLFHRYGLSRPSLEDIAQQAGVTRGAVYWHFKNKHALFAAICESVDLPMQAAFPADCEVGQSALTSLQAAIVSMLVDTAEDVHRRQVFEILAHKCELVEDNEEVVERRLGAHHHSLVCIEGFVRAAIETGELPADIDAQFAAAMVHAFVAGCLDSWTLAPDSLDMRADAERIARVAVGIPARCTASPHPSLMDFEQ